MGRLTFILFLVYSLPVGMHHLMIDPKHGNGDQIHSGPVDRLRLGPDSAHHLHHHGIAEIAGRLRGGKGVFGWIGSAALGASEVLATGLVLRDARLRRVRRADQYGLRHERHGAQYVVGDGALPSDFRRLGRDHVFAIAYEIWPRLTGRDTLPAPLRWQLWLWFIGMMVMTLPWHWLGLQGQWRRVANFNYADPIIAAWGPLVYPVVRSAASCCSPRRSVRRQSRRAPLQSLPASSDARCMFGRASAASRSRGAQRLWALECAGSVPYAVGLRLSIAQFIIDPSPWPSFTGCIRSAHGA